MGEHIELVKRRLRRLQDQQKAMELRSQDTHGAPLRTEDMLRLAMGDEMRNGSDASSSDRAMRVRMIQRLSEILKSLGYDEEAGMYHTENRSTSDTDWDFFISHT